MADRDTLGRRRRPGQNRGLRPLYPPLPDGLRSRSVRLSMSEQAWLRLGQLADDRPAPTRARALGETVERLLWPAVPRLSEEREGAAWLDWQARKERRLLEPWSA